MVARCSERVAREFGATLAIGDVACAFGILKAGSACLLAPCVRRAQTTCASGGLTSTAGSREPSAHDQGLHARRLVPLSDNAQPINPITVPDGSVKCTRIDRRCVPRQPLRHELVQRGHLAAASGGNMGKHARLKRPGPWQDSIGECGRRLEDPDAAGSC